MEGGAFGAERVTSLIRGRRKERMGPCQGPQMGCGCGTERANGASDTQSDRDTDKLTTCPVVRRMVAAAVIPAARWCVPGTVLSTRSVTVGPAELRRVDRTVRMFQEAFSRQGIGWRASERGRSDTRDP